MIKSIIIVLIIFLTSVLFHVFTSRPASAGSSKSSDTIKIVLNNWTSQVLLSKITGRLFEKMGYPVEYRVQDTYEQWGALNRGIVHVQVETWEGTNAKLFNRMIKAGGVIEAGIHDAVTREDWWYPFYVEKKCPGLPDWQALKACYKIFTTRLTDPFGRYLTGPWEKPDRARIRALDMKFKVVELKDGQELNQALLEAVEAKQPIVLFNWTPNWVEAKVDGKFIEFPEYDVECETDPSWGVNPKYLYDCGNPRTGWLKKAAWAGMPKKWPCAFKTLQQINFNNPTISRLTLRVDVEKKLMDNVVDNWIISNEKIWLNWIPEECRNELTRNPQP